MNDTSRALLMSTFLMLFISCSPQTATNEVGVPNPADGQGYAAITTEPGNKLEKEEPSAENTSWIANEIIIASRDYDFDKNHYLLNIDKISATSSAPVRMYTIDFSQFAGILTGGMYTTSGEYYPVQLSSDAKKVYWSIYSADEMEGTFDWCKLLEYNTETDTVREIAQFSDFFSSWILSEENNHIYGFTAGKKALLSINLNTLSVDTLFRSNSYFEDATYVKEGDKLVVIPYSREDGLLRLTIDLQTQQVSQEKLYSMKDFSSYRNGMAIETYTNHRSISSIKVYTPGSNREQAIVFSNHNTYWLDDQHFVVKVGELLKVYNLNLQEINSLFLEKVNIVDVIGNALLVSYYLHDQEQLMLLSKDFQHQKPLDIADVNAVVYATASQ